MHHPVSPQIKKFFGNMKLGFFIRRSMPGGQIFYTVFAAACDTYFYIFLLNLLAPDVKKQ